MSRPHCHGTVGLKGILNTLLRRPELFYCDKSKHMLEKKAAPCEPGVFIINHLVLDEKTAEFVLHSVTQLNVRNLRVDLINIMTDVAEIVGPG